MKPDLFNEIKKFGGSAQDLELILEVLSEDEEHLKKHVKNSSKKIVKEESVVCLFCKFI